MILLTKELKKRFREIGTQENHPDPIVVVKYFYPVTSLNWFATEYDPDKKLFFGYIRLFSDARDRWWYFSLEDLKTLRSKYHKNITGIFTTWVERDLCFKEKSISEALRDAGLHTFSHERMYIKDFATKITLNHYNGL